MKKCLIIILCISISLMAAMTYEDNAFLIDSKNLINMLLTLLGLCFTSFSFISLFIDGIIKKSGGKNDENFKERLNRLLDSIQKDIFLILYSTIVIIILNTCYYFDFPLIKNPTHLDFGLVTINSLKNFSLNFIISLVFCLSLYSLYDLVKASFILLRKCY